MAWIYLILAGIFEILWSTFLKFSNGFSVLKYSIFTIAGMIASFVLLSQAIKTLPLGTSYAIWTGIGAAGAVIIGIIIFKEPITWQKMFFTILLFISIIGLKISSYH